MRLVIALILVIALAPTAGALDTATRSVGPVHTWSDQDLADFAPDWLHVKFVEGSDVALQNGRFTTGAGADLSPVNAVVEGAATLRRTFSGDREYLRELKRRGEAASGQVGPDLSLWYDVRINGGRATLAGTLNALNALTEVEIAHPAPRCEPAVIMDANLEPAPVTPLPTPDYTGQQTYLYDTPVGLNAPAAWAVEGGRGAGMRFIDVELWWVWTHEDFDPFRQFYNGGIGDDSYSDHGTAVLGEVIGRDNDYGVTGFASDTQWGTVGITVDEWPDVPHYFQEAIDHLNAGDVWLIELQMYPPETGDATPMEYVQANYDVIWTGSWALGVVCIEAGANGSQNLDAAVWNGIFDRNVRDSGAIMVGAGTPIPRQAEWFTNYGSRMDVHAWGSEIVTAGYGDLHNGGTLESEYTANFGGTSGASPMITGSALCLQGIAKANLGAPLTPADLRALLHDTGIDHLDPVKEIGPRPDLGLAVEMLVDITAAPAPRAGGLTVISTLSPFDHETEIRFSQARAGDARLEIFDVAGRRVRAVDLPSASAGARRVHWDGRDDSGNAAGSGVYLFRLVSGSEAVSGRMVKVR